MGTVSDLFFGLSTAVGYGTSDFVARQASHRIGHVRVLFYMELVGFVILAALVIIVAGISQAQSILTLLLVSVFLAVLGTPPVLWLTRKKVPNAVAVLAVFWTLSTEASIPHWRSSYALMHYGLKADPNAAAPAHWKGCGAQTKLYCWSLIISWMMAVGPWAKPNRQPVIP